MNIRSLFREYTVHFTGGFQEHLHNLAAQNGFFIVDAFVWEKCADKLEDTVPQERLFMIDVNENNKSLDQCREIIETLVDRQFRRNEKLVGLGGGITQDLTAFSASILYRGVEWAFIPTTLLAQSDSCIGSKTSINLGDKKNLIGNFYPPTDIFIDVAFLDSLSVDDIRSGIGEIMHYYLCAAESDLLDELNGDCEAILLNRHRLRKHIRESLRIKKAVIEKDEFDNGERNKFNYGHTFGHAIESVTDYTVKHGQAVTLGMDLANFVSMKKGFMSPATFHDIHDKLSFNFPNHDWYNLDFDRYIALLLKDKKNIGKNIGCILARAPGLLFKQQVPSDESFREIIHEYFTSSLPTDR